ncbi:Endopolyphosphatase [Schizosaccharomyces pombe]
MRPSVITVAVLFVQSTWASFSFGNPTSMRNKAHTNDLVNSKGKPLVGRFLHITDMHPDIYYEKGSTVDHYCHSYDHNSDDTPLGKSKVGYLSPGPGYECDSSPALIDKTLEWLKEHQDDVLGGIDFILWTGDNSRHDNDNHFPRTQSEILASNEDLVNKMIEAFPDVPIVSAIGNNDIYPHNIMEAGPSSMTRQLAGAWDALIPYEERHTFEKGSYYLCDVIPDKLAAISINTLYLSNKNAAVDGCPDDNLDEPGSLFMRWFKIQLEAYRLKGMKVWLLGHIPPTRGQWYEDCYTSFTDLLYEFRDIIVGQLYGHMNINHFVFLEFDKLPVDTESYGIKSAQPKYVKSLIDAQYAELPTFPENLTEEFLNGTVGNYSLATVGGSIIPEMFPTFRVYEYNISDIANQLDDREELTEITSFNWETLEEQSQSDYEIDKKKKKKKKNNKKKKKNKRKNIKPGPLGPAYVPSLFTPISFKQYFLNTSNYMDATKDTEISYELLYTSKDSPYNMPDLTVPEYMRLAKRIATCDKPEDPHQFKLQSGDQNTFRISKKKKPSICPIAYTYLWHAYIGSISDFEDSDD